MEIPNRTDVEGTIITNLVLAGLLKPNEVARYLMSLSSYGVNELIPQLMESYSLIGMCLENKMWEARN